jgi:Variant SH3 domain
MAGRTPSELPRARVIRDYVAQYPDPIRVRAHEIVGIERQDDEYPDWWWCTAADGRSGWVPGDLFRRRGAEGEMLEDYNATELTVRVAEEVRVIRTRPDWLFVRNAAGEHGWIPAACVAFE